MMAPVALAERTDDELAELYAADLDAGSLAALTAECERRDHAERAAAATRAASRARNTEWETAAYAQYQAVMAYGWSGGLLSEAGKRTGREPWPMLWQGGEDRARELAAEEVTRYWDHIQPRTPGPAQYAAAVRDAERAAREAAEFEAAPEPQPEAPVSARAAATAAMQARRAGVPYQRGHAMNALRLALDAARVAGAVQRASQQRTGAAAGTVAVREPNAPAAQPPAAQTANPADGMTALSLMSAFYGYYDYWPCQEYTDLLAAWSLQCHAVNDDGSPIWRALGRLVIAAMHGTGKSGTLDNISAMTGAVIPVDVSYAGVRNAISQHCKPLILDDAQMVFGAGKENERVRKIFNAHTAGRVGMNANGEVQLYVQMAAAGLPSLLAGKVGKRIEDTLSRCFILWKVRKPKGLHIPELSEAAEYQAREKMQPTMREWCHAYRDPLKARAAEFGAGAPTGLPDLGGGGRGNDQLARSLLAACDVATALVPDEVREADPSEAWDWSARIRRALIFVSGVPEPAPEDDSPLDGVAAAFADMWAADSNARGGGDTSTD